MSENIGCSRRALLVGSFGSSLSLSLHSRITAAVEFFGASNDDFAYVYLTLHTLPLPSPYEVASCAALQAQVARLKAELQRIDKGSIAVGQELRRKFEQNRAALRNAIVQSAAALESKKVDSIAANIGAGVAVVLTALGAVLEAPIAVGTVAVLEILSGPTILGWQLCKRNQVDNSEILIGYARDRAYLFASLAAEKATSTPGKVVAKSMSVISLLSSFSDAFSANVDKQQLLDDGKRLHDELVLLNNLMDRLGANDAAWGNCYRNVVASAIQHLTSFVQTTRNQGCTVQGPIIIRPPS